MNTAEELTRLREGADRERAPTGLLTSFIVRSDGHAMVVLTRVTEALQRVIETSQREELSNAEWARILPAWLVESFAPERSQEEAEAWLRWWRQLPPREQARAAAEDRWSLENWLYWFRPEQRSWRWWTGQIMNPDSLEIVVETEGLPVASGALEWLIRAAGGRVIEKLD